MPLDLCCTVACIKNILPTYPTATRTKTLLTFLIRQFASSTLHARRICSVDV